MNTMNTNIWSGNFPFIFLSNFVPLYALAPQIKCNSSLHSPCKGFFSSEANLKKVLYDRNGSKGQ